MYLATSPDLSARISSRSSARYDSNGERGKANGMVRSLRDPWVGSVTST